MTPNCKHREYLSLSFVDLYLESPYLLAVYKGLNCFDSILVWLWDYLIRAYLPTIDEMDTSFYALRMHSSTKRLLLVTCVASILLGTEKTF